MTQPFPLAAPETLDTSGMSKIHAELIKDLGSTDVETREDATISALDDSFSLGFDDGYAQARFDIAAELDRQAADEQMRHACYRHAAELARDTTPAPFYRIPKATEAAR